jgi:hypothetical protein
MKGLIMPIHHIDRQGRDLAVEQSLDAAIELDEVIQGKSKKAPALTDLVLTLIGASREGAAPLRHDLLSDSQLASLYYRVARSTGQSYPSMDDLRNLVELLLTTRSGELASFKQEQLSFIRDFCLGLNKTLVAEAFSLTPEPPLSRSHHQKLSLANGN